MNLIDKVVEFISPSAAYKRERYRAATKALRSYDAAAGGRRTSGLKASDTSANAEIERVLPKLRARMRQMVRNNPYAKSAIDTIATNVVGDGIRPAPTGLSARQLERVKELWKEWAGTTACDFDGQETFYGLQRLTVRSIAEGGEVLIRVRRVNDPTLPVPIQLQVLEGDYLDWMKSATEVTGRPKIVQGVEFDAQGKRVAYWLHETHPGDGWGGTSKRVPADEILHVYRKDRPGQVRGVPVGVSAMIRLMDFDDYEDAQLVRQKIAACFVAFVQDDPNTTTVGQSGADVAERLEPGAIEYLPSGKTITMATPPAVIGYDEYSRTILRAIAKGFGVTYEALTGDLSNVNFSSGRMGWLEFSRVVGEWQEHVIIPKLCDPVWRWFMDAAIVSMKLRKPAVATWTAPRREMIDPVKEVKGITESIRSGLISWEEAVRSQGYDPETVLKQIADNFDKFKSMGLMLTCDPRYDANRPPEQTTQDDDAGDGDGTEDNDAS